MKIRSQLLSVSLVGTLLSGCAGAETVSHTMKSKEVQQVQQSLSQQQLAIIPIAAFAATGDLNNLNQALNAGLNQGLTINEIKSVLVQTYAYAGFPRSLNALGTFMQLLEQRKAKGITDTEGRSSQALPEGYQAIVQGTENQTKLVGQPVQGPLFVFAPEIDEYLKSHLFGDIFSKDVLSWQDRELATVSMLAAMTGTEGQLKSHVQMSLNVGITPQQLQAIQQGLSAQVSKEAGQKLASIINQ